jgi:hypothetical protein
MKSPKPNLQDQIAILNRRIAEFERRDTEQSILLKGAIQKGGELLGRVAELEADQKNAWEHYAACARTPLMRDVMAERDRLMLEQATSDSNDGLGDDPIYELVQKVVDIYKKNSNPESPTDLTAGHYDVKIKDA